MFRRPTSIFVLALAVAVMMLATFSAAACSVPVFRYALEKWPSDPYQALVFHQGPLTSPQQTLVRELEGRGAAGPLHANLSVRLVDLADNPTPEQIELWRQQKSAKAPWVVVKYPVTLGPRAPVWAGPLTETAAEQIPDSPARQEIVDRLAHGESAVWVMLESGNAQKDNAIAELLETRLAYLASTLKLPKLEAQDIADKLVSIPEEELKLEFSTYRLSRKSPGEVVFVSMLLATEKDLQDATEPVVFPIFGRGRSLYALVGKGINRETIDRAATFLIGKCSCQVKEQNPGVDLLFAADWNTLVKSSGARELPVFTNLPAGPETVVIHGGETKAAPANAPTAVAATTSTALRVPFAAALLIVAMGAGFLLFRK
jgi:hypothetical protein